MGMTATATVPTRLSQLFFLFFRECKINTFDQREKRQKRPSVVCVCLMTPNERKWHT